MCLGENGNLISPAKETIRKAMKQENNSIRFGAALDVMEFGRLKNNFVIFRFFVTIIDVVDPKRNIRESIVNLCS